jgi:hypothetical protein
MNPRELTPSATQAGARPVPPIPVDDGIGHVHAHLRRAAGM